MNNKKATTSPNTGVPGIFALGEKPAEISSFHRGDYEDGVIIKLKPKGYRYITNKRIIIKPQVVCSERR